MSAFACSQTFNVSHAESMKNVYVRLAVSLARPTCQSLLWRKRAEAQPTVNENVVVRPPPDEFDSTTIGAMWRSLDVDLDAQKVES